ncbi:MAG: acyl-CoA reductase [Akkermansiaceae bacterium]
MNSTEHRIKQLSDASKHALFAQLVGEFSEKDLTTYLEVELGRADALDTFSTHGNIRSKAITPEHILHIVSGNTPHASMQSVFRGLLLGSANTIKLPAGGLPELALWIDSLQEDLRKLVTLEEDIENFEWSSADVVIAIGSDSTINAIQNLILPHQTFIPHGHKISVGIVIDPTHKAADLAAKDVSLYDQRGCLSLHAIYVDESSGTSAREFSNLLAKSMADFATQTPPNDLTLSEAGAIHNFRETIRFQAANGYAVGIIESSKSLDWTVVYQNSPTLHLSCLGRCVFVKPLPKTLDLETLGEEARHLSTIALHPFDSEQAEKLIHLPAHRICPLGQSQSPSLFWHHDGFAPLSSMVKWQDIG